MQREPAEGKDENQAEDGFGDLPPLQRSRGDDDICIVERQGLKPCNAHCWPNHCGFIWTPLKSYLLEVLAEGFPNAAIPVVEHLAGHQSVEYGCAE